MFHFLSFRKVISHPPILSLPFTRARTHTHIILYTNSDVYADVYLVLNWVQAIESKWLFRYCGDVDSASVVLRKEQVVIRLKFVRCRDDMWVLQLQEYDF